MKLKRLWITVNKYHSIFKKFSDTILNIIKIRHAKMTSQKNGCILWAQKRILLFYVFFNSKKQKGVNKMQNKKVVFINKLDTSVLDSDFYLALLKNIQKLKQQNEQKTTK